MPRLASFVTANHGDHSWFYVISVELLGVISNIITCLLSHVMSLTFVMIPSYNSQVCGSVPRREAGGLARS